MLGCCRFPPSTPRWVCRGSVATVPHSSARLKQPAPEPPLSKHPGNRALPPQIHFLSCGRPALRQSEGRMRHPASLSSRNPSQLHGKYRGIPGQRLPVSWLPGVKSSFFLCYGLYHVLPPLSSFSRTRFLSRADGVVISASSATAPQFPFDTFIDLALV